MTQVSHHHLVNGIHNVQHLVPGDVAVVVQVVELEGPCNQPARTESALARGRGCGPTLHLSMQSSQEPHTQPVNEYLLLSSSSAVSDSVRPHGL